MEAFQKTADSRRAPWSTIQSMLHLLPNYSASKRDNIEMLDVMALYLYKVPQGAQPQAEALSLLRANLCGAFCWTMYDNSGLLSMRGH